MTREAWIRTTYNDDPIEVNIWGNADGIRKLAKWFREASPNQVFKVPDSGDAYTIARIYIREGYLKYFLRLDRDGQDIFFYMNHEDRNNFSEELVSMAILVEDSKWDQATHKHYKRLPYEWEGDIIHPDSIPLIIGVVPD